VCVRVGGRVTAPAPLPPSLPSCPRQLLYDYLEAFGDIEFEQFEIATNLPKVVYSDRSVTLGLSPPPCPNKYVCNCTRVCPLVHVCGCARARSCTCLCVCVSWCVACTCLCVCARALVCWCVNLLLSTEKGEEEECGASAVRV